MGNTSLQLPIVLAVSDGNPHPLPNSSIGFVWIVERYVGPARSEDNAMADGHTVDPSLPHPNEV